MNWSARPSSRSASAVVNGVCIVLSSFAVVAFVMRTFRPGGEASPVKRSSTATRDERKRGMERAAVDRQARAARLQDELNATAKEIGAGPCTPTGDLGGRSFSTYGMSGV